MSVAGFHRGSLIAGIFFIIMGVVFLLDQLDVIDLRPGLAWPLLLIGFGVGVLAGAVGHSRREDL
jgi:uncharacterized membrane protein YfcA